MWRFWARPLSLLPAGCGGRNRSVRRKSACVLLTMALALCSACSTLPQKKEPQPRPILPTLVRMDRGGLPGVWMGSDDAANLTLWIQHMEAICR